MTTTLYRPVGPGQLQAILESGSRRFPARRGNQKYFYPLLHECFARRIACEWHLYRSGVGYVTAFQVETEYLMQWPVFCLGREEHREFRIPAAELYTFNQHIVGRISVVGVCEAGVESHQDDSRPPWGGLFQQAV